MPDKEPHDIIGSRTAKSHARTIILLLGLMAVSSKAEIALNIDLIGENMMKIKMRKSRGNNSKLKICNLSDFELHQVRYVLESIHSTLPNKRKPKPIILYSGFSRSDTGFRNDFMEGDIVRLCHTHVMDVIGASSEANHE